MLQGQLPAQLAALAPTLKELRLAGNQLSGKLPDAFVQLAALEVLDLSRNALEGGLPPTWQGMAQLRQLKLASNKLSGALPATYFGMTALQVMDISGNEFSGSVPARWRLMARRTNSLVLLNLANLPCMDAGSLAATKAGMEQGGRVQVTITMQAGAKCAARSGH
ncbi:hypothetical protein OEZ86_008610 [Tetradesmus obliquus]|nr:hypothetical protein OEZ86_008610 [Tetradesmus obliquus]